MRSKSSSLLRSVACMSWVPLVMLFGVAAASPNPPGARTLDAERRVQGVVDDLRAHLAMTAEVTAQIVPLNPLLVSVESSKDREHAFVLSFEDSFLGSLSEDDLRAVVAHELGHVWIFTHHPYLQTERLANQVAMRVVGRAELERVYAKVWQRQGTKGDLTRFLGQ